MRPPSVEPSPKAIERDRDTYWTVALCDTRFWPPGELPPAMDNGLGMTGSDRECSVRRSPVGPLRISTRRKKSMFERSLQSAHTGQDELERVYHPTDVARFRELEAFCPDFIAIIRGFGLGSLWQRPTLTVREKELVVLGSLITQGCALDEMRQHVHTSLQRGLLLDEILECLVLLTAYVGIPRTLSA